MPTKRQHYIPVFYLKRFLDRDGETLLVYDKERLSVARQTPNATGVEGHIYTIKDFNGNPSDVIETGFLQKIDSEAKPLLDRVSAGGQLTTADTERLAEFVAVMHARVPRQIQTAIELDEAAIAHHLEKGMHDDDVLELANQVGASPEFVRQWVNDPEYYLAVRGNRKTAMLRSFRYWWHSMAETLLQMNMVILRIDKPLFITSDAPVVITVSDGKKTRTAGFKEPRAEVIFVVDPNTCVHYSWGNVTPPKHPREVSQRVAWCAERYVYSSKRDKAVMALVKEARVTRSLPKIGKGDAFKLLDEMDEQNRIQRGRQKQTKKGDSP